MTHALPRGVSFDKTTGRYRSRITRGNRTIDLGTFDTADAAEDAYLANVSEHGLPKRGALTPEQSERRRLASERWNEAQPRLEEEAHRQLGPFDFAAPWRPSVSAVKINGQEHRLVEYRQEVNVFGETETVVVFNSPCQKKGCQSFAESHIWIERGSNRDANPFCEDHNAEYQLKRQQYRAMTLANWDAVHRTMGRDRLESGPLPTDRRPEAQARADAMRPYLRGLLEHVYEGPEDLPSNWYERFVRPGFDTEGDPLPAWTKDGNEASQGKLDAAEAFFSEDGPSRSVVRYGRHERHVIEVMERVYALDDGADYNDFLEKCIEAMPAPAEGRRDVRRFEINRAIQSLAKRRDAVLRIDKGRVIFCS